MTTASPDTSLGRTRVGVQRFGSFLSNMVLPNIAAFIAFGILAALFIPTGFTPNETLAALIDPLLKMVIPLLIAYTGGRMVYDHRGGVVGAVAALGVIVGGGYPDNVMILGAMIAGPLAAWLLKQIERLWRGRIRPGFEMLVDNFSAGIFAFAAAIGAFFGLTWVVQRITEILGGAVGFLVDNGLLPLVSIIVEPAKVLFLNNAINHGVFTPLGAEQVDELGKSIFFLIEANPGPGAGLLLAITAFGVGAARATAPGAFVIQFVGGIHEVYFPYVLAKPLLIVALILGGASGVLTNVIFGSGLIAPASPGSIIAVMGGAIASGSALGVALSVVISAAVTFVVAAVVLRASRRRDLAAADAAFSSAIAQTEANKGKSSTVLSGLAAGAAGAAGTVGAALATTVPTIENIVFACDAGMGSSAMGASVLRKKLSDAGISNVTVVNKAIANLDATADLVITQKQLTDRAKDKAPDAVHVSVDNFMNSPAYDEVVTLVAEQHRI